jgi:hypothetical protein
MTPVEVVQYVRRAVDDSAERGKTRVTIAGIRALLDGLEQWLNTPEVQNATVASLPPELRRKLTDAEHAWDLKAFEVAIGFGQSAIKSLLLINGGAAVALFALLGSMMESQPQDVQLHPAIFHQMVETLVQGGKWFAVGVFTATLATCLAYLAQTFYNRQRDRYGNFVVGAIAITAAASVWSFIAGAFSCLEYFGG